MNNFDRREAALSAASRILDDAWCEVQRGPYVQVRLGVVPTRLPDLSFAEAERRSIVGRSLLARLDALDRSALPHELALSLRLVRFRASTWAREAEWYWTAADPRGIGSFSLFLPTAYCGGYILSFAQQQLASFVFEAPGDTDRYLGLVADYAGLVDQMAQRTAGQAGRGMYMSKAQVPQSRALLAAFKSRARSAISVAPERLAGGTAATFTRELEHRLTALIEPAFDGALAGLSDAYLEKAPDTVGMHQYPHGGELYGELVKLHTTLELTPEQVHARGLERMGQIEESMRGIRAELGLPLNGTALTAGADSDGEWRAGTVEGVRAVFQRYIDRILPLIERSFRSLPQASFGVEPLPEALQGSMTFGFYDAPRRDRNCGTYFFNAANLTKQALFNVAALTYHELVPGHHLQLSLQQENPSLPPFRAHSFVNAYIEGWAEYAATLAGEMGAYERPQERYGRLQMDAFLTSRLVVDTGMNVLGWSLERAREYMRVHSGLSEAEILTETVRYCDRPAQVLAYKLGDTRILSMRELMRERLGSRFDLKSFHAAVLDAGALPMTDLEWHIRHETECLATNLEDSMSSGGAHS